METYLVIVFSTSYHRGNLVDFHYEIKDHFTCDFNFISLSTHWVRFHVYLLAKGDDLDQAIYQALGLLQKGT